MSVFKCVAVIMHGTPVRTGTRNIEVIVAKVFGFHATPFCPMYICHICVCASVNRCRRAGECTGVRV